MADLALLPNVLWTPDGGELENAIDGVRATMTGGVGGAWTEESNWQTLLAAKAPVIAEATDNLLTDENASFEGATTGGYVGNHCVLANDSTQAFHGSKSLKSTQSDGAGWHTATLDIKGVTAAGTQYTASVLVKGTAGETFRISLVGDTSGNTSGTAITADGTWRLATVTKRFAAGDTTTREMVLVSLSSSSGEYCYWDAVQLEAKAYATPFALNSRTASTMTFPTPFTAGEAVSFLIYVWTPWPGNDGVEHNYLDCRDASGYGWRLYKSAANNLLIETTSAAGTKSMGGAVNGTNMAAGRLHAIGFAIHADNTQILALNGTLLTTSAGAAGREAAVNANLYMGSDKDGANHGNCAMLPFAYNVAWGDEECEYMSSGAVTPYSPDRSAMYCHHPNKAIYALKAPYKYIDARRDN